MLMQIDGSNPMGARPYPRYPKIQAIGVRNVYDLSVYLPTAEVYFTDNGPEANDRLVIAPLFNANQFDFGWDGTPASMLTATENGEDKPQYIVDSWPTPVAPVDIIADSLGRYMVNVFSTPRSATTEMLLGEKVGDEWETTQIVRPTGAVGNILGLALSFRSGTLFFGDFKRVRVRQSAPPKY